MKGKIAKIILIVIVVAFVFIGYTYFFTGDSKDVLITESSDPVLGSEDGKLILSLLVNLRSLDLEASIFNRLSFLSLIDFGQVIPDRPKGRVNPFAPIDGVEQQIEQNN